MVSTCMFLCPQLGAATKKCFHDDSETPRSALLYAFLLCSSRSFWCLVPLLSPYVYQVYFSSIFYIHTRHILVCTFRMSLVPAVQFAHAHDTLNSCFTHDKTFAFGYTRNYVIIKEAHALLSLFRITWFRSRLQAPTPFSMSRND